MKKIFLFASIFCLGATTLFAQKYIAHTAKASFNATTPTSPEKIEAVNNEVSAILDAKSGDFIFQVLIKSFKFERDLMQQHFNENYMESDKYPKSQFIGKIANIADVNFSKDGSYNVTVTGKLAIHGATQDVTVPGTITIKGNEATAKAKFKVALDKYNIKVPGVVADKVAKEASIAIDAVLTQK